MEKPGSELQIAEGAALVDVTLEALASALGFRGSLRVTGIGRVDMLSMTFTVRVDGPGLPFCPEGSFPDSVPLEVLVDG